MRLNNMLNIKDMVGQGKKVRLERIQNVVEKTGLATILQFTTETGFRFEVRADELGEAPIQPEENAMLFMRWIRKAIERLEAADEAPVTPAPLALRVVTIEDADAALR
jgi:hypothetical protein